MTTDGIKEVEYQLSNRRKIKGRVSRIRRPDDANPTQWQVGDCAELTRTITREDILAFADLSWDTQAVHTDIDFATREFGGQVAHGMLTASLVSALCGNIMPGPGAIYLGQQLSFKKMVLAGHVITARVSIVSYSERGKMKVDVQITNGDGDTVAAGDGLLVAGPPQR